MFHLIVILGEKSAELEMFSVLKHHESRRSNDNRESRPFTLAVNSELMVAVQHKGDKMPFNFNV